MKTNKLSIKMAITAIVGIAIFISIMYVAYLSNKEFEKTIVGQTQQELLTIANSIATSMEQFFIKHSNVLAVIANNPLLRKGAYETHRCYKFQCEFCPIINLYEVYKKEVDALTLLDKNGIMLHRSPFIKDRIGMDHTDKPGVAYIIREQKPHVSELFYNNLGNLAISILEPIFYKDEFTGIVRWMIETDTVAKRFIEPTKVGKKGFVWMFDNKNIIISHPRKEFIGISVLDAAKKTLEVKNRVFDKDQIQEHIQKEHDYLNRVKVEEEGIGTFINCATNKKDIIVYKRVQIGNTIFNLVITLPYFEIIAPIHKHAKEIFGLAGFVIILLSAGGFIFLKNQKEKAKFETETRYLKQIADGTVALRESEEKYRMLFNSTNDPMFVHQPTSEGIVRKFIEVNDIACQRYGYTREEFLQLSPLDITPPEEVEDIAPRMKKLFAEKHIIYKKAQLSKEGKRIPVEISSHMFDLNDQPTVISAVRDISERKQAEKQINLLSQQLIRAQEIEKQMISRELHDSVAQDLSAIKIGCDTILDDHPEVSDGIRQMVIEFSKTLQNSIMAVRDMAYDLRPPGLDQLGIIETIFQYCKDFSEKTDLNVDFSSAGMEDLKLNSEMKINLYRLVQEGLINIKNHAEARQVTIRLVAAFPNIILRIKDDGKGFDVKSRLITAQNEKRMGLLSMEERVSLLGGEMNIESRPEEGTNIVINFPCKDIDNGQKEKHINR